MRDFTRAKCYIGNKMRTGQDIENGKPYNICERSFALARRQDAAAGGCVCFCADALCRRGAARSDDQVHAHTFEIFGVEGQCSKEKGEAMKKNPLSVRSAGSGRSEAVARQRLKLSARRSKPQPARSSITPTEAAVWWWAS